MFLKSSQLPSLPFDADAWSRAGANHDSNIRLQMVDDILQRDLLEGKTPNEILALLGDPSPDNYFKNLGYEFMYRLGGSGFIIKGPSYLAIAIDDGQFVSAKVLRD